MYDGCLIDFGLIFKGFRADFEPKFHLGWTLGLFWAYFGIMEGHWRGGGEPDAGKSLSKRESLAAHLHFEAKSGSASLLKAPQSLPKGFPNRIKVMKRNNHQRIDELYAFEGGFFGEFGCQIDDFCRHVSKIELSIVSSCWRCNNMQKQLIFPWFCEFDALDVETKSYEKVMKN